jgi:pimeloyl-ACP methyl ester carboxylesterase
VSSALTTEGMVHYEMHGRGAPVVLLHGWLNSWDVWRPTMLGLSERGRHRIYALDFWGWGESDKRAQFTLSSYASMVMQFMGSMGIAAAPVIGHSMGGTVALTVALDYPQLVKKVAIVGSPIRGNSLNWMLRMAGRQWVAHAVWRVPHVLDIVTWRALAGDRRETYEMIRRDVSRTTLEAFFLSIGDLRRADLRSRLDSLTMPAIGIFGVHDNIVNPNQAQLMSKYVPHARVEMMGQSRHFPMRDEPEKFLDVLSSFLS